ncbi:reverse transcriptase [Colletotrichum incanum]|uniref:Reverse transcriptase n=1 Tax=Colletotrichum incanum TaxID=1573173 RepID=A0A166LM62_COLIC|nr:reverse transcriptase [Colletotrichum incanum]
MAERISYAVETYGLLPTSHFGARKQRSAEQALVLLQEHIYRAWRIRKVLSLVNGHDSEVHSLPQAGLPQGSPLSPVLFLFFNADLVQHQIDEDGGALAFVDDYTAWVTGPSREANRQGIQAIIDRALDWERRSGATFEADKTAIIHFTRNWRRPEDYATFDINGDTVRLTDRVKILGVVMDSKLRFTQHLAGAATKGLEAVLELRRLKGLSPSPARQLFVAAVAPTMDYASNMSAISRVQRIGAQAIVGTFNSVVTAVAEAEAGIQSVQERFDRKAIKFWARLRTLPQSHPLRRIKTNKCKRHISPFQKMAAAYRDLPLDILENISAFSLPPWKNRVQTVAEDDGDELSAAIKTGWAARAAIATSAKNDIVGYGRALHLSRSHTGGGFTTTEQRTAGPRMEQNPFTAELAAMATALDSLAERVRHLVIYLFSSSKAAVSAVSRPRQQSGQQEIWRIYEAINVLKNRGNRVSLFWLPAGVKSKVMKEAKAAAKESTRQGETARKRPTRAYSTALGNALQRAQAINRRLPEGVGNFSKKVDAALPGIHMRQLYDDLSRKQASVLAQLRTGMARLNWYLHQMGAVATDQCTCGQATETV